MPLFLGVDGGQSSTTALIGDEQGRILGYGRGGPCNHVGAAEGRAKFVDAITGCVSAACEQAGLHLASTRFGTACPGFSGGPKDKEQILPEILSTERLLVTHDALIALVGATGGNPGMITIAGTGSIAFGRSREGKAVRAGGWGYIFGDEGGGFDLTRQALRAALRYEEGWGPFTRLHPLLLEATGTANANDLMHRFYTTDFPRPRIASFSRLVEQAAAEGDGIARELLVGAAQQLAMLTAAVRSQLFQAGEPAAVSYIGGVFQNDLILTRYRLLTELTEGNRVAPPRYGPATGALLEAYAAAGIHPELTNVPEAEK